MAYATTVQSANLDLGFYGGLQPGDVPLYTIAAAARTLALPASTVRWWAFGRAADGYQPVVDADSPGLLTFNHLVELHVVKALTRGRGIPLQAVRRAVEYAATEMKVNRVLLSRDLFTFGDKLLFRQLGEIVDISRSGQLALEQIVETFMHRIERFDDGLPSKLHPSFTSEQQVDNSYPVSMSPLIAFGEPTLAGTGIKTAVVTARVDSGETPDEIAEDYGVRIELVMNALVFESAA